VHHVAGTALILIFLMDERHVFMASEGVLMAFTADRDLLLLEKIFRITGMGTVTFRTAVTAPVGQMAVRCEKVLLYLIMAS